MFYTFRDWIASEFAKKAVEFLPIEMVILFGSTARKDDRPESDIDLAIVATRGLITRTTRRKLADISSEFLVEFGVLLNWILITPDEYEDRQNALVENIRKDGIVLWAKEKIQSK